MIFTTANGCNIGIETGVGGEGGGGGMVLPIFYPRDFINIHSCSADRCVAVYIMFGLPKMELLPTPRCN